MRVLSKPRDRPLHRRLDRAEVIARHLDRASADERGLGRYKRTSLRRRWPERRGSGPTRVADRPRVADTLPPWDSLEARSRRCSCASWRPASRLDRAARSACSTATATIRSCARVACAERSARATETASADSAAPSRRTPERTCASTREALARAPRRAAPQERAAPTASVCATAQRAVPRAASARPTGCSAWRSRARWTRAST